MFYNRAGYVKEDKELRIFRGDDKKVRNIYVGNGLDILAIVAHLYPFTLNIIAMDITHLPPTPQPTKNKELSDKKFYPADILKISFLRLRNALTADGILYIHAYKDDAIRIKSLVNIFNEEFLSADLLFTGKDELGEKYLLILSKGIIFNELNEYTKQMESYINEAKGDSDTLFRLMRDNTKDTTLFMTAYDINRFHADMLIHLIAPKRKIELKMLATANEQVVEHIHEVYYQTENEQYSTTLIDNDEENTMNKQEDEQSFINAAVDSAKTHPVPRYISRELMKEQGLLFEFYQELSAANILFLELNTQTMNKH